VITKWDLKVNRELNINHQPLSDMVIEVGISSLREKYLYGHGSGN